MRRKEPMRRRTAVQILGTLALLGPAGVNTMWAQGEKKDEKKEGPPSPPEPKVKVGDTFPDFTLIDQNRNKVSLHDFKGKKNVAVAFVVFAFTPG
jgi:cytochrome oxidase Cu insertion factor (SCO1/SenC/PrrC family)